LPGWNPAAARTGTVDAAIESSLGDEPLEMFLAPVGPIETRVAAVTKMAKAALQQMVACQTGDRRIVRFDIQQFGDITRRADINGGQGGSEDRIGDGRALDPGNNSVAVPLFEPHRCRLAASLLADVNRPRPVLADVSANATQQAARIGIRGFDEQSDIGAAI